MNSSKSFRIILSGMLVVLAVGIVHLWLSDPDAPAGTSTFVQPNAPVIDAPQRPGVRFQPAVRSAPVRTTNPPTSSPEQRLYVEWKGTWYPAEILASSTGSNFIHNASDN